MDRLKEIKKWGEQKIIAERYGMKTGLTGYLTACYSHNLENMKIIIGGIILEREEEKRRKLLETFEEKYGEDKELMRILRKTIEMTNLPLGYCRMI